MKKDKAQRPLLNGRILSGEPLPKIPLIEIVDGRRVLIENHLGVIGYGSVMISVKVRNGIVCIEGRNLEIVCMAKEKLVICGQIECVRLCNGGN